MIEAVRVVLDRVLTPAGVEHWLGSAQSQLDMRTPVQAIGDGDGALVLQLADSLVGER
jgi:hypothetical protein